MANVYAVKSGNWSDTTVWNTGALPTSADDVYSNTFTVEIDTTTTVLSIRNGTATGIAAGGTFNARDNITLTCTSTSIQGPGTTSPVLTSSLTLAQAFTFVGNITCGNQISSRAVNNSSSGTLNIVGNILAGANSCHGVINNSSGTVNIVGNVTGGNDILGYGVQNFSVGTVNITGNVTGGAGSPTNPNYGANNNSTGVVNITGNVTGGTGSSGANNASTGDLTIIGSINASVYPGLAAGAINQNTFLTGPFIGTAQGVAANCANRWRWVSSVGSSYMTVPNSTATGYKNLYTSDSVLSQSGQPAASNVRSGTVYGPASELTGTCVVPSPNSVAYGVPVDNTTGNAVLTPAAVKESCSKAVVPALLALS